MVAVKSRCMSASARSGAAGVVGDGMPATVSESIVRRYGGCLLRVTSNPWPSTCDGCFGSPRASGSGQRDARAGEPPHDACPRVFPEFPEDARDVLLDGA